MMGSRCAVLIGSAANAAIAVLIVAALIAFANSLGAATSPQSPDNGRLFRIAKRGTPDSYVLGTLHVADPRVATLSKPVIDALAATRVLAVEIVPEARDEQTLELEQLERGERLEKLIG